MKDIISGLAIISFGCIFIAHSLKYSLGTFSLPGPGLFPSVISGVLLVIGFIIFFNGLRK